MGLSADAVSQVNISMVVHSMLEFISLCDLFVAIISKLSMQKAKVRSGTGTNTIHSNKVGRPYCVSYLNVMHLVLIQTTDEYKHITNVYNI